MDYQLEQSVAAGQLDPSADLRYEVEMPNVFLRDMQQVSKSLVDMTTALTVGQQENWIDAKTAGKLFRTALEQLGVEVNAPVSNVEVSAETPVIGSYRTSLEKHRAKKGK